MRRDVKYEHKSVTQDSFQEGIFDVITEELESEGIHLCVQILPSDFLL